MIFSPISSMILVWILSLMSLGLCADFGEDCSSAACSSGLICDGSSNTCGCASDFRYIRGSCIDADYGRNCTTSADCRQGTCVVHDFVSGAQYLCTGTPYSTLTGVQYNQFVDDAGVVYVNVTWDLPEYLGITHVVVDIEQRDTRSASFPKAYVVITAEGATHEIRRINGGWSTKISVAAKTQTGEGPKREFTFTSMNGMPGNVVELSVSQNSIYANEMRLSFSCPQDTDRNGLITGFIIRKTLLTEGQEKSTDYTVSYTPVAINCEIVVKASLVGGIEVPNNYTFEVKVENANFEGNFSDPVSLYASERKPIASTSGFLEDLLSPEESDSQEQEGDELPTSFKVKVCPSCFTNPIQGAITAAAIIICATSKQKNCDESFIQPSLTNGAFNKTINKPEDIGLYDTWAAAKAKDFTGAYRTTPDNWIDTLLQDGTNYYVYDVGSDENCDVNDKTIFCNGPVLQDEKFVVSVVVCNNAGCDETKSLAYGFNTKAPEDDDDDDDALKIGLGVGLSLAAIIIICVIVYCVCFRSRNSSMAI